MKCVRCQASNTVELWAGNGFVCPFCQKWYCGQLRAVYLAKFGNVAAQAVAVAYPRKPPGWTCWRRALINVRLILQNDVWADGWTPQIISIPRSVGYEAVAA